MISIIVCIYNCGLYISKCIDSLLNQTYTNYEIIIIDDGSTDNGKDICTEYSNKYDKVKVTHIDNHGISNARNLGIQKSTGNYICFVDADDYVHPKMLEILYDNLLNKSADISVGNYTDVLGKCEIVIPLDNDIKILDNVSACKCLFNKDFVRYVVVWNKLYKRELFHNIEFPLDKNCEDDAVIYQLYYKAKKVVETHAVLYYYVQHDNSIINNSLNYLRNKSDRIYHFENRYKFFIDNQEQELASLSFERLISDYMDYLSVINRKSEREYDEYKVRLHNLIKKSSNQIVINKKKKMYIKLIYFNVRLAILLRQLVVKRSKN